MAGGCCCASWSGSARTSGLLDRRLHSPIRQEHRHLRRMGLELLIAVDRHHSSNRARQLKAVTAASEGPDRRAGAIGARRGPRPLPTRGCGSRFMGSYVHPVRHRKPGSRTETSIPGIVASDRFVTAVINAGASHAIRRGGGSGGCARRRAATCFAAVRPPSTSEGGAPRYTSRTAARRAGITTLFPRPGGDGSAWPRLVPGGGRVRTARARSLQPHPGVSALTC